MRDNVYYVYYNVSNIKLEPLTEPCPTALTTPAEVNCQMISK